MNPALKKKLYHYAMVTLACAIMGIAMNTFYMPNKMLSGGIGGVAVLAYYVAGLPMGATSLICNVPLFFLAYKYMDREYTISALYGIIAFSVSLDFFHFLSTCTVVHDKLLACIAGGVLYGIGAACMYRVGGSSGGTDIIGAIIQKNYSISISTTGFAFNICLLLASVSLFGIEPVLYTLLTFCRIMYQKGIGRCRWQSGQRSLHPSPRWRDTLPLCAVRRSGCVCRWRSRRSSRLAGTAESGHTKKKLRHIGACQLLFA